VAPYTAPMQDATARQRARCSHTPRHAGAAVPLAHAGLQLVPQLLKRAARPRTRRPRPARPARLMCTPASGRDRAEPGRRRAVLPVTAAGTVLATSDRKSVAQPLLLLPEAFPDDEPPLPPLLTAIVTGAAKSGGSPAIAPPPAPSKASPGPISVSPTSSYP
jgi:hypothetical protein